MVIKYNSKAVKLSGLCLLFIEDYRNILINSTDNENKKKYYKELSYDKIIRQALLDITTLHEKLGCTLPTL